MARKGRLVFYEMLIGPVSAMTVNVDIQVSKIAFRDLQIYWRIFITEHGDSSLVWVLGVIFEIEKLRSNNLQSYLTNVALDLVGLLIPHGVIKAA